MYYVAVVGGHGSVVVERTSSVGMPTEPVARSLEGRNKGFEEEKGKGFVVVVDFVDNKKGKRVEQQDLESMRHEAVEQGMDKVGLVC